MDRDQIRFSIDYRCPCGYLGNWISANNRLLNSSWKCAQCGQNKEVQQIKCRFVIACRQCKAYVPEEQVSEGMCSICWELDSCRWDKWGFTLFLTKAASIINRILRRIERLEGK
jgi:hypothetical protein